MDCCIIIPAYKPSEEMIAYLGRLEKEKPALVLVVDDGSGANYGDIFARVAQKEFCTVLRHEVNRGKGEALKTAMRHYMGQALGHVGVITVDCDGQHGVPDVVKVYEALESGGRTLVLGSRSFGEGTPQRSALGNRVTSKAMDILYDIKLQDTQTGLRGIPRSLVPEFEKLGGKRYEYELNMLIYANKSSLSFTLVPIKTIYFNNNSGSHYRTVPDSIRMVGQLLKGAGQYILNALLSAAVDIVIYTLLLRIILIGLPRAQLIFFSTLIARVISSLMNYAVNRRLPYVQNKRVFPTMLKYYVLWGFQLGISFGFVLLLNTYAGANEVWAKIFIDLFLGLIGYQIQMRWVFRKTKPAPNESSRQEQEI